MAETWTPPAGDKLVGKAGTWTPPEGDKLVSQAQTAAKPAPAAPGEMPPFVDLPDGTRMVLNPQTGQYTNAELMAGNMPQMGAGQAALSSAANGATFGWIDEAAGAAGLDPIQVERMRAEQLAAKRDAPVTSMVSGAGGNILGGYVAAQGARALPVVGPALGAAQGLGFLGKSVASGVAGAGLGALQGAGEAMPGQRAEGAGTGAMFGAAFGAAAPAVGKAVGAAGKGFYDWVKSSDVLGIARALEIPRSAARIIKSALSGDDVAAAQASLRSAGDDAMLADASPQASNLLDTAVAMGGPAQRVARDAVETRATAANARLRAAMDAALGKTPTGLKSATGEIATKTAAAWAAAYDKAYATAIDYASDAGQAIEAVLGRIPNKTFGAAIQEANDAMKAAGVKNMQIMAQVADDGTVTFMEMPNVQQLDFLKRSLDQIARDATDAMTGKVSGEGARAAALAADLRKAIGDAAPSYSTAVKLGGDKIAEENALKLGRNMLAPNVTRETVAQTMLGASREAKAAAKRGLRLAIDEAMANVRVAYSNNNLDAKQVADTVSKLSSDAARGKAAAILGPKEASKLFASVDEAMKQLELKAAIAKNSATASRQATDRATDAIMQSPLRLLQAGEVNKGVKSLIQIMTGQTPEAQIAQKQAIYAEIAKALTEKRGREAQAALSAIQGAMQGAPISAEKARLIAKSVGAAFAALGYQSTSQSQRP